MQLSFSIISRSICSLCCCFGSISVRNGLNSIVGWLGFGVERLLWSGIVGIVGVGLARWILCIFIAIFSLIILFVISISIRISGRASYYVVAEVPSLSIFWSVDTVSCYDHSLQFSGQFSIIIGLVINRI